MAKANTWGDYKRQGRLFDQKLVTSTPVTSDPICIEHLDGISLQLITEDVSRSFLTTNTDTATSGTKTFVFANGAFLTGEVGDTITITGSALNDGTFTIATRSSATTIIVVESITTETFPAGAAVVVTDVDGSVTGAWKIEASNTYSLGALNDPADPGKWSDVTSLFAPSAVTDVSNQCKQSSPFVARGFRVTFTPSGGQGLVSVYGFGKGNR